MEKVNLNWMSLAQFSAKDDIWAVGSSDHIYTIKPRNGRYIVRWSPGIIYVGTVIGIHSGLEEAKLEAERHAVTRLKEKQNG